MTQIAGRKTSIFIEYNGEKKSLLEWSYILRLPYGTLWYRIAKKKLPAEAAFVRKYLSKQYIKKHCL